MRILPLLATSLLATTAIAQNTSAWTVVNLYGVSCQSEYGFLSNNVEAASNIVANYDASTGIVELTVWNTTPVISGESNATIHEVHFNLPPGAVTSASLLNQTAAGGATPAFALSFDEDTGVAPDTNSVACFGNFNVSLVTAAGGIANAAAPLVSTPNPVIGPITFEIQLTGPGTDGIEAETIMATTTQGGNQSATIGMWFEGGGVNGAESGYVGSCDICRTALYTVGDRSPGGSFELKVTGTYGCHACVWTSLDPGPFVFGNITVPIGLPIVAAFTLGNFGLNGASNAFALPVNVPNDPGLSGFEFYAANVTYNALDLQGTEFSPRHVVRID